MSRSDPPILAAVADAVYSATAEQLPLPDIPLWSRALRRLPPPVARAGEDAVAVVSLAEVRDAARHLAVVGLLRRDGGNWTTGLLTPQDAPIEPRHERLFWEARRRSVERGHP